MQLLGAKDVGVRLGMHERTAIRLFESGEMAALKVRGRWRVRTEDYEAYLRRQATITADRLAARRAA
jgi:excisionase family DNA binding protein